LRALVSAFMPLCHFWFVHCGGDQS
jgi:hypothetical protein